MPPIIASLEIGMLQIEFKQLTERLLNEVEPALAKENNKRNRKAKQDITERLSYISRRHKELDALLDKAAKEAIEGMKKCEEADAARAAKAAQKEKHSHPKKSDGKRISCTDCENDFFFGKGEQAFYAEKGLAEPTRCKGCRAAKKAARPQPLTITCIACEEDFEFSVGAQRFFEENGWEHPVRCAECRKAKKAEARPLLINCARCHKDFTFSAGKQKEYKEKGWVQPLRCFSCRPLHKAEMEAKTASEAGSKAGYDKVDGKMYE